VITDDLTVIVERLRVIPNNQGIVDAICSLLRAAELDEMEATFRVLRRERRPPHRCWLEWIPGVGWRCCGGG